MPEILGYVNAANVKANPTLDWGSVITDVQDTIVKQEQQRQATRDKMAKEYADLNKELNKISLGRTQDVNGFLTNSVYKAKEVLAEADKLYKSGKINSKQYNLMKQNISSGFNEFDALGKNISKIQEEYAKLAEQNNNSFLADFNMGQLGNSLDLKNKVPYVDPATGYMYVAPLDANGMPDLNKLDSASWMIAQADMPAKVNLPAEVDKYTKDLGKYEYIPKEAPAGGIWTIDNIKENPEFDTWLKNTANGIAFNDLRMASVLGDNTGGPYKATSDPNAKGEFDIVIKKDLSTGTNVPVLTDAQKKAALDVVKNQILSRVNQTLKQQEGTYRPRSGGGGGNNSYNPPKGQYSSGIEIPANGKGAFVPMSGVNVKIGPKLENIPTWGIDSNGKLFVDVVTGTKKDSYALGDGSIVGETESKRYSENNLEFKKRLKYLINPNTGKRVSSLAEAKSVFGSTQSNKSKTSSDPLGIL